MKATLTRVVPGLFVAVVIVATLVENARVLATLGTAGVGPIILVALLTLVVAGVIPLSLGAAAQLLRRTASLPAWTCWFAGLVLVGLSWSRDVQAAGPFGSQALNAVAGLLVYAWFFRAGAILVQGVRERKAGRRQCSSA